MVNTINEELQIQKLEKKQSKAWKEEVKREEVEIAKFPELPKEEVKKEEKKEEKKLPIV